MSASDFLIFLRKASLFIVACLLDAGFGYFEACKERIWAFRDRNRNSRHSGPLRVVRASIFQRVFKLFWREPGRGREEQRLIRMTAGQQEANPAGVAYNDGADP